MSRYKFWIKSPIQSDWWSAEWNSACLPCSCILCLNICQGALVETFSLDLTKCSCSITRVPPCCTQKSVCILTCHRCTESRDQFKPKWSSLCWAWIKASVQTGSAEKAPLLNPSGCCSWLLQCSQLVLSAAEHWRWSGLTYLIWLPKWLGCHGTVTITKYPLPPLSCMNPHQHPDSARKSQTNYWVGLLWLQRPDQEARKSQEAEKRGNKEDKPAYFFFLNLSSSMSGRSKTFIDKVFDDEATP